MRRVRAPNGFSLWQEPSRGKWPWVDFELHPIEVDRRLRRAHQAWLAWKLRPYAAGPDEGDAEPLEAYRSVTGLTLFRQLTEMPESDPLRAPLRRWVYRLAEQRINQPVLLALQRERRLERPHPDVPGRTPVSVAGLLRRALGDGPRREPWSRLFVELAPPVSACAVVLWQRRAEVARRMGLSGAGELESPVADASALAEAVARATRERVRELGIGSLAEYLERAIGADVAGAWPARLSPQRLLDYFREGELLRSLDLAVAPLPESLGAASFGRALAQVGAAWLEALAPRDQPFVVAHDPYGLARHEAAALFGLLPLNSRFARRYLDVPQRALPDVQRRLAQIWLLALASNALRVRLRRPALAGGGSFREAYAELAHADLGLSLPQSVAGALFALGVEDEQALIGQLLAVAKSEALCEEHDEDWFRNPRAIEQLRAEASLPPPTQAAPERLAQALGATERWLTRLLR